MIAGDVSLTVGRTPLVELRRLARGLSGRVVAKLEMRNPYGSAVEPAGSAVLSGGSAGSHRMPGMGVGFIPDVLNRGILDEVVAVTDDEAFACARRLAREEGIVAGVSSGAALHAAMAAASRGEAAGAMVVVLLADTGERYLATERFARAKPA